MLNGAKLKKFLLNSWPTRLVFCVDLLEDCIDPDYTIQGN